jgi:hypothetical protein
MERSQELIEQWVGQAVLIQMLKAPNPTPKEINRLIDNPDDLIADHLRTSAQMMELVAYDSFGVLLRERMGERSRMFVPWSAILDIHGVDPAVGEPGE